MFSVEVSETSIYNMFQLPLSLIAHEELHNLEDDIATLNITDQPDS
jgi:hypothetical protein